MNQEVAKIYFNDGGIPSVWINGQEKKHIISASIRWETGDGVSNKGKTVTTIEYGEEDKTIKKVIIEKV